MDDFHRLLLYFFLYLIFYLRLEIHTRSMPGLDRPESLDRNVRMYGTSTPGHAYAFATTVLEWKKLMRSWLVERSTKTINGYWIHFPCR